MDPNQKLRTALALVALCLVYLVFMHFPGRVDKVRTDLEKRMASLEKRPQPRSRGSSAQEDGAGLASKVKELEERIDAIGDQPTPKDLEGIQNDLRMLQGEIQSINQSLADLTWQGQLTDKRVEGYVREGSGRVDTQDYATDPPSSESTSRSKGALPEQAAEIVSLTGDWRLEIRRATQEADRISVAFLVTSLADDQVFTLDSRETKALDENGRYVKVAKKAFIGGEACEFSWNTAGIPVLARKVVRDSPTEVVLQFQPAEGLVSELRLLELKFWDGDLVSKFSNVPVLQTSNSGQAIVPRGRELSLPTVSFENWKLRPACAELKNEKLLVTLYVTNESEYTGLNFTTQIKAFDQLGREFAIQKLWVAETELILSHNLRTFLEGVETEVVLEFPGDARVESVSLLSLSCGVYMSDSPRGPFKPAIKDIPICR